MSHSHHHGSHKGCHHEPNRYNRAFLIGTCLNVGFVAIEAIFGFWSGSLALLADAGHNLSDVLGLLLAWGGSLLAQRPPTSRHTYGLRRASILAALLNSTILLLAMGAIAWEAIQRLSHPTAISGWVAIWVAGAGVLINGLTAFLFASGRKQDLNIKGAFLHMAADTLVSAGVVLAGVGILLTNWFWLDPAISLTIVVVVAFGTWQLFQESLNLALDAVPSHIEPAAVREFLVGLSGVTQVHDLHIWAMSTTDVALTAHLVMPKGNPGDAFLLHLSEQLQHQFGIGHTTIQVEQGNEEAPCHLESDQHI